MAVGTVHILRVWRLRTKVLDHCHNKSTDIWRRSLWHTYRCRPASMEHEQPRHHSKFWTTVTRSKPMYGAGESGTLTDADQHLWNMNNLGTIQSSGPGYSSDFLQINNLVGQNLFSLSSRFAAAWCRMDCKHNNCNDWQHSSSKSLRKKICAWSLWIKARWELTQNIIM